ncbi:MAG TPA: hypothetical protein PLK95_10405, partial [Pseudothermotoga sp.]|nr:hypothetical protein [Pseudothermotoga sp.]
MPDSSRVPLTPPRVPLVDPRTGTVSREWYMFFLSMQTSTKESSVSLDDMQKGPPAPTIDDIALLIDQI